MVAVKTNADFPEHFEKNDLVAAFVTFCGNLINLFSQRSYYGIVINHFPCNENKPGIVMLAGPVPVQNRVAFYYLRRSDDVSYLILQGQTYNCTNENKYFTIGLSINSCNNSK